MSFRVHKEVDADKVITPDLTGASTKFELTFTGPFTRTVTAEISHTNNIWSLVIPRFMGTATNGSTANSFVAHLPSWVPTPPVGASVCCPLVNDGDISTGYITAISGEGKIVVLVLIPRVIYTNGCGLPSDVVLPYSI